VIDSHCHLADVVYADDLEEVVGRAREAGVSDGLCILACGDAAEAAGAGRVRALWPSLHFAVGVHPHQADQYAGGGVDVGEAVRAAFAATPGARAIGEIGLDYHYEFSARDAQRRVFRAQISLAREIGRPVVVHTREADDDTVAIIREEGAGQVRGVFHCFSGTAALADQALDLGFMLSFAGIVTFPNAEALRAVAARVPADRLLVETDCPYLAPVPMRGHRNEPAWVVRTLARLAEIRGVGAAELEATVAVNFVRLFGA
jgi:TatD DNase family protein